MPKYNVELEFWKFVYDVEAENEQEAIKNALIKLTNNPEDFSQHQMKLQILF